MPHDIFISYRRDDARADAGRLYDRLSGRFGEAHVFMDIEDIEPGQDFVRVLDRTLEAVSVMIVLIGRRWLGELGEGVESGAGRIADERDFVRIEVEKALERGIQVIPVLVGSAEMPPPGALPASMAALSSRHAFELGDARFHEDVDRLIELFDEGSRGRAGLSGRNRVMAALAGAALLLTVGAIVIGTSRSGPTLRAEPVVLDKKGVLAMLAARDFFDARWYASGAGPAQRYEPGSVEGDLIVTDAETSLMWQRSGSGRTMPRGRAAGYIDGLNGDRFAGHQDWRLPTLEEAMSLNAPDNASGWHLSTEFEAGAGAFVWTSDTSPSGDAWVVYYLDGLCQPEDVQFNAFVRAVRSP